MWSEWLPVPPPQTDVNLGMTSTGEEHQHSYTAEITEPDCVNDGYTTYTCDGCGDSYVSDNVSALGHDILTNVAKAPTCVR